MYVYIYIYMCIYIYIYIYTHKRRQHDNMNKKSLPRRAGGVRFEEPTGPAVVHGAALSL